MKSILHRFKKSLFGESQAESPASAVEMLSSTAADEKKENKENEEFKDLPDLEPVSEPNSSSEPPREILESPSLEFSSSHLVLERIASPSFVADEKKQEEEWLDSPAVTLDDVKPYERDEPGNPSPIEPPVITWRSKVQQWILKPLSWMLPILTGYFFVTRLDAAVHEDDVSQKEIQTILLLGLSVGAALQNITHQFPQSRSTQWLRRYQYRLIPFEFLLVTSFTSLLSQSKYALLFSWFSFRYGGVLVDLFYERVTKKPNATKAALPGMIRESSANEASLSAFRLRQHYGVGRWRVLIGVSLSAILSAHVLIPYRDRLGDPLWQEVIIDYAASVGYVGLGFCLGDYIEWISARHNPYADTLQKASYYLFTTLLTPGSTPLHLVTLTGAGILQGWNSRYAQREIREQQRLLDGQIRWLDQLNATHLPLILQCLPYAGAHKEYLIRRRRVMKVVKFFRLLLLALYTPVGFAWLPWRFVLGVPLSVIASFFCFYAYLKRHTVFFLDPLRHPSSLGFLFQSHPLIIAGIFALMGKIVVKHVELLNNANLAQVSHPAYWMNMSLSNTLAGLLITSYYFRWYEQAELVQPIDPLRFKLLKEALNPAMASPEQKSTIPLTPREIYFITERAGRLSVFNQHPVVRNYLETRDGSLTDLFVPPQENQENSEGKEERSRHLSQSRSVSCAHSQGFFATPSQPSSSFTLALVKESKHVLDPDKIIETTMKTVAFLSPVLSQFPIHISRQTFNL